MRIYTKSGDEGSTGLFGGDRISKAHGRVEAYGEVDELNSVVGLARVEPIDQEVDALLAEVQRALFDIGAELASDPERAERTGVPRIGEEETTRIEQAIDRYEQELPALKSFVLPGGTAAAARLHLARTVCRRAERRLVALSCEDRLRPELLRYVNRLSDLLFVLGRLANHRSGVADVPWIGRDR